MTIKGYDRGEVANEAFNRFLTTRIGNIVKPQLFSQR